MSTKIMVCMADNVMKNNRIYNKGDHREALASEKESNLWKSLETIKKREQEAAAIRLSAEKNKDLKKLQEENAKLKIKIKDLEAALAEKADSKKTKAKVEDAEQVVETQGAE